MATVEPLPDGTDEFIYRVSAAEEWLELQSTGATFGGDLDRRTGCIHLSRLHQVKMVLRNFFMGRDDLYLLKIDAQKLGDGLVYEAADESNCFPHLYGPSQSFVPLPFAAVVSSEKLQRQADGEFSCTLLG